MKKNSDTGVNWLHLRTSVMVRWAAIFGQFSAVIVSYTFYQIKIPLVLCLSAIAFSVVINLASASVFPRNRRLSEGEARLLLLFDLMQLTALLYLTGGLNNPFSLLILAPVIISASALKLKATLMLGGAAIASATFIAVYNIPLNFTGGYILEAPPIFTLGFWLAIVTGILFIGLYAHRVSLEMRAMSNALFATQIALAREQKLTDLGGVIAAAAHELGTPLATIKLVSTELITSLKNKPNLAEDAILIKTQAERCSSILQSMGKTGKDDLHIKSAPFISLLKEAAEPHQNRGKTIHFSINHKKTTHPTTPKDKAEHDGTSPFSGQLYVTRQPEILYGLRNLVQNAVDFATQDVWLDATWNKENVVLHIRDDGPGFPPHIIDRIGDPLLQKHYATHNLSQRPAYEGMGLGLFIAKTLLERTGAELIFSNSGSSNSSLDKSNQASTKGANILVMWPRKRLTPSHPNKIKENLPICPDKGIEGSHLLS